MLGELEEKYAAQSIELNIAGIELIP